MYENSHFSELSEVVIPTNTNSEAMHAVRLPPSAPLAPPHPAAPFLRSFACDILFPDISWFPSIRLVYCFLLPTTKPSLRLTSYSLENATEKCNFNAHFSHLY